MPFSYAFMKAEWQAPRHGSGRLHLLAPASATGDFAKHDGFAKHSAKPNSASPKRHASRQAKPCREPCGQLRADSTLAQNSMQAWSGKADGPCSRVAGASFSQVRGWHADRCFPACGQGIDAKAHPR